MNLNPTLVTMKLFKNNSGFELLLFLLCAFLIAMFLTTGGCKVYKPVEPMRSIELIGYPNTTVMVFHMRQKIDYLYYPDLDTVVVERKGRAYNNLELRVNALRTVNQFIKPNPNESESVQRPGN